MDTSIEALEGNKVRLHVAVPAVEFEPAIDAAFRQLAREVKIPGFRPGKAPRRLLEARFGPEVARDRALRDALPGYYADAVESEQLDTIARPEIEITAGEDNGDIEFDAVVELRPVVALEGYEGIRVVLDDYVEPGDEQVDAQVDALRDRFADLEESVSPLADGDYAEIDIKAYVHDEVIDGLTATDFLYEVGSGLVVDDLDAELQGKRPGDILKFNSSLPERFGDRAGEEVSFQVLVKDAKRKVLPHVTDEWVSEVSEHETVAALRAETLERLRVVAKVQAQMALRDRVLDAAADLVTAEAPEPLVDEEMERRLVDLARQLEGRDATIPQYLDAIGQDQQEFVAAVRAGSVRAVLADLALRAVVDQEAIEATDDDVSGEVERLAERMKEEPRKVRRDLEQRGILEAVRSDIARGKALQFLADHAVVVDGEGHALDLTLPTRDREDVTERVAERITEGDVGETDQAAVDRDAQEQEPDA